MFGYVAKNLTYVGQKLEENEDIVVRKILFKDALKMVQTGAIQDAKTIALILYFYSLSDH